MKRLLFLFTGVMLMSINACLGAQLATFLTINPLFGAIGLNVVSLALNHFMPVGLRASVFTEVWTGYLNKAFKKSDESVGWYSRIGDFSRHAAHDMIHFINIGGNPKCLVNNKTYPIGVSNIQDADKPIGLDCFQTEQTIIPDDDLHSVSYDVIKSHNERHKDSVNETKYIRSLHSIAPTENTTDTPVLMTTGELVDGRRRLTAKDLLTLKTKCDKMRIPLNQRVLVLCADHYNDLLADSSNLFKGQVYDEATGRLGNRYGFTFYQDTDCPYFTVSTKKKLAWGAIPQSDDTQGSIFFADKKVMRADGSLKMYYSEAKNNPATQSSSMNYRKYQICLPFEEKYRAAIISAVS